MTHNLKILRGTIPQNILLVCKKCENIGVEWENRCEKRCKNVKITSENVENRRHYSNRKYSLFA